MNRKALLLDDQCIDTSMADLRACGNYVVLIYLVPGYNGVLYLSVTILKRTIADSMDWHTCSLLDTLYWIQ